MDDSLQATLDKLIKSGSWSNPVQKEILDDYAKYHGVLVLVGGFFALIYLTLTVLFWRVLRAQPRGRGTWSFEKKSYAAFSVLSGLVGLVGAFVVAVNAHTFLNPKPGFTLLVQPLPLTPKAGTPLDRLYQGFDAWLRSGNTRIPAVVQDKINERIGFEAPKAIVFGIVLVVSTALGVLVWRTLIKRFRVRGTKWTPKEAALLASGVVMVAASLVSMVIVVATTQGALAPIATTMTFG
jgi:hypothetical protein